MARGAARSHKINRRIPLCPCCGWRHRQVVRDELGKYVYADFCFNCKLAARLVTQGLPMPPIVTT